MECYFLDPGRLVLPRAGRQEQQDDQEEEDQLASPEGFRLVSNRLSIHCHFPF
jgi:hypothetical protein